MTKITQLAFERCTGLTSITIPNSVTEIQNRAFDYCTGLTSITIPSSITNIGNQVFDGCTSLIEVIVEVTNPNNITLGDDVFRNTNNCPIYVPSGTADAYRAASKWSTYANRIKDISERT